MRAILPLLLAAPVLLAASAPVPADPVGVALRAALAEARAAEAEQQRLEQAAEGARSEAARLGAEQAAAAQAIVAAEARISAADASHRLTLAQLGALQARLERQQRPAAALLAGLALMARRPPLLALADGSSADEMVRVRLLLDATLPLIRRRAAALSAQLREVERLERRSAASRQQLAQTRAELKRRQQRFAALEARAIGRAQATGGAALGAGDVALAAGEDAERLTSEAQGAREAAALAREIASLGPAPLRPAPLTSARTPLRYRLPAVAPLVQGFGAVSPNGVRSRGVTLATRRGATVVVPADGIIRFSGPFRDYDGVVIIDHGGGWMSLIVNVVSPLKPGTRVSLGARLGRALGPVEAELARNGTRVSPALIAGSSATLSNMDDKG